MRPDVDVTTVSAGDHWLGVYVDGRLVMDGGDIRMSDIAGVIIEYGATEFHERCIDDDAVEWLEDYGYPALLSDFPDGAI